MAHGVSVIEIIATTIMLARVRSAETLTTLLFVFLAVFTVQTFPGRAGINQTIGTHTDTPCRGDFTVIRVRLAS